MRRPSFTLVTPANHYPSRLPNFRATRVVKLVTPRHAPARFGLSLLEVEAGGGTSAPVEPGFESFLYGLDGALALRAGEQDATLRAGGFAYLPATLGFELEAAEQAPARLLWLKRRYEPWPGLGEPEPLAGHRDDEPFAETDVPGFRRRELIPPGDPRFDFNMSLLAFEPGVGLGNVELHDEEHGLYMTGGAGSYHLDGEQHEVCAHDFVYMAPYCPQSFTATGRAPAEYLLYKDVYRDGF